jgi:hypothetical protein
MNSTHPRNVSPMLASARCGAKTRGGMPCKSPAVSGKKRCRMHGGAPGSGAPFGNRNAYKTGAHTAAIREEMRQLREFRAEIIAEIEEESELLERIRRRWQGRGS